MLLADQLEQNLCAGAVFGEPGASYKTPTPDHDIHLVRLGLKEKPNFPVGYQLPSDPMVAVNQWLETYPPMH